MSAVPSEIILRRVRSFVRRDSRKTSAQTRALNELWPVFGVEFDKTQLNFSKIFDNQRPCYLEIGFGSGQSLLELAKSNPQLNFIGIETHRPGIGALLLAIEINQIKNIRILNADAVDIFREGIPEKSLEGIQIFFPDPWPKRRHHIRRLIQIEFVNCLAQKLKTGGTLHLATDWQDYAIHMMKVLSQEKQLMNGVRETQYAARSPYRPIQTKFERRALREGRAIWELQFLKV